MPAVGRCGLRSANEKGGRATGELVRCTTGAAACGVGLASPACCWKRSTMADVKMRDSSCVRRELGFAAPDGWVPLAAGTRRGLTCRMGGSRQAWREPAALLHQEGEPRPTLNRQGDSRRG